MLAIRVLRSRPGLPTSHQDVCFCWRLPSAQRGELLGVLRTLEWVICAYHLDGGLTPVLHWGLTPLDKINDEDYHPEPYFLHTILAKGRDKLQPSKLFSHVTMPRLDGINEPLLVRTLYEFTGQCFAISLKGPDGAPGSERSVGDGQGVLTLSTKDVVGRETWQALEALSEKYVSIG